MKLTLLVTLAICRTAYADIDAEKVEPSLANLSGEASGATAFVAATLELEASVASGEINLKALETARDHINKTADDIKMMRGQPEIYTRMRTKYLPRLEKAELATASTTATARHVMRVFFIEISSLQFDCSKHAMENSFPQTIPSPPAIQFLNQNQNAVSVWNLSAPRWFA